MSSWNLFNPNKFKLHLKKNSIFRSRHLSLEKISPIYGTQRQYFQGNRTVPDGNGLLPTQLRIKFYDCQTFPSNRGLMYSANKQNSPHPPPRSPKATRP